MFEAAVEAAASGYASAHDLDLLSADPDAWVRVLRRLIMQTDDGLVEAARLHGDEREQVLSDLRSERRKLADALRERNGDEISSSDDTLQPVVTTPVASRPVAMEEPPGELALQASWVDGRVVVWAGGPGAPVGTSDDLDGLIAAAEGSGIAWERHASVPLPSGESAEARSAPIAQTLGWLVGVAAGQVGEETTPSLGWLADVAAWGTQLVAEGRMVPVVRGSTGTGTGSGRTGTGRHRVRWVPALVERDRLVACVAAMPGAVAALQGTPQPDGVCRSVLSAVVDAVSRAGAARLVAPATLPEATSRVEISEAILSGLDGRAFTASSDIVGRLAEDLKRWAMPVTTSGKIGVSVGLDPPAADGGWLLSVQIVGVDKQPLPVEHALVVASGAKAQQVEAQMRRLERLLPVLRRPSTRRGQVILDVEEATDLMFTTGPVLAAAGFEVYLPRVSRRRPSPQLRLFAEALGGESQVGIQQLANVRWSVFFDDLELDAAAISRLAAEAKPLVQVRGRWVHIDRADLVAAAAALAERADITQLSGAALLRHAVGLEGSSLGGPLRVEGSGWAVDLLRGARSNPPAPVVAPEGFEGELRHYQADAVGWLGFLDRAGLGGCLAMDMGLGKTPTVLAQLRLDRGHGPVLVVCPPAVLSNWATEAARFTPELDVAVHHGPRRAAGEALTELVRTSDVVLSTYATTVRDMDQLSGIEWRRVVVDEAQAIKNHQSETAQAVRRLRAWSRLALTGTPVENGLGDLWSILDFTNPGLVGGRTAFVEQLSRVTGATPTRPVAAGATRKAGADEGALQALVFRRTKMEPEIAAELPDKVDKLDNCSMTPEQVGLYQAVVERLLDDGLDLDANQRKGQVLAAITALKQICDHPAAFLGADDERPLAGRSGKLARLEQIVDDVFASGERILVFTHFARWGERLAAHLTAHTGTSVDCYHGGLARGTRDKIIEDFQNGQGPGALVLSIKAGGSGLNLTAANHVVLYDRWWNPAVEDQARDRAWRIGQTSTVVSHRLVCPGTVDERVEEIVAGKRRVAGLVLPARSSLGDLDAEQLRVALGLNADELIEDETPAADDEEAAA
jgi:superfamily II DNA or RNA helicase